MLEGLGKNFIFLITPYGDDSLALGAYDFYSFVKLRIIFHSYPYEKKEELLSMPDEPDNEKQWEPGELKQKLEEANDLINQSREKERKAHYFESEKLLLKARAIKEKILGAEHLEMAAVDNALGEVYRYQGKYGKAEELHKKSLQISRIKWIRWT